MRTEQPAICYSCGADVEDGPRFGAEATCDACRRIMAPDHWRAVYGMSAPFTFEQDGSWFVCAWHPGFNRDHPANRNASHGICPSCIEREGWPT
jgi:hypothetical protein